MLTLEYIKQFLAKFSFNVHLDIRKFCLKNKYLCPKMFSLQIKKCLQLQKLDEKNYENKIMLWNRKISKMLGT